MERVEAYIVAARRTAMGRVGGLHRARRLEALTTPVLAAVLKDAGLTPTQVDEVIVGSTGNHGNPARMIALAAGLPEDVPAYSIDQQCASGFEAIMSAVRKVASGERNVIIAGGADSPSTAPWRIAKPPSLYHMPQFIAARPTIESAEEGEWPQLFAAAEAMARDLAITRAAQDQATLEAHQRITYARTTGRFDDEIVPLKTSDDERRDQAVGELSREALEEFDPLLPPEGTLTIGNTAHAHDGAALTAIVSRDIFEGLGRPPALQVIAHAALGVPPGQEAAAPMAAMERLSRAWNGFDCADVAQVELAETSSAQAIAFGQAFAFDETRLNPDGGAVVRGHPQGAAGAVLITRLFSGLARGQRDARYGIAAQGALGGLGMAALFEAV
ncbi:MAG: thiolase family protein [Pseudomonadota bacterium]